MDKVFFLLIKFRLCTVCNKACNKACIRQAFLCIFLRCVCLRRWGLKERMAGRILLIFILPPFGRTIWYLSYRHYMSVPIFIWPCVSPFHSRHKNHLYQEEWYAENMFLIIGKLQMQKKWEKKPKKDTKNRKTRKIENTEKFRMQKWCRHERHLC